MGKKKLGAIFGSLIGSAVAVSLTFAVNISNDVHIYTDDGGTNVSETPPVTKEVDYDSSYNPVETYDPWYDAYSDPYLDTYTPEYSGYDTLNAGLVPYELVYPVYPTYPTYPTYPSYPTYPDYPAMTDLEMLEYMLLQEYGR